MLPAKSYNRERALLLGNVPIPKAKALIEQYVGYDILFVPFAREAKEGFWSRDMGISPDRLPVTLAQLRKRPFDLVMIPYEGHLHWENQNLITLTDGLAPRVMLLFPDGRTHLYQGEDVHRLQYSTAYLNRLLQFVPPLAGKRLLDVGCSDGLICDLMLNEAPESIVGIDILADVGCEYSDPRISYFQMDASQMQFEDHTFDVCYCIAVLEHVKNPLAVLREIKRVTRRGGYSYIQAGPLYFSPYGHHMFGYFDDYPWIHLRLPKAQIAAYAKEKGNDQHISQATGMSVETYLDGIFNIDHLNRRQLKDYHLDQFMSDPDIETVIFIKSFEGENLLTSAIRQELSDYSKDDLVTHGFELVFRVK